MRYAPGERLALDGLSFTLDEGDCLRVVGPSGAGKTTLVNVLLRFWEYQDGSVELGGRDLRSYSEEAARSRMAVVARHTYLFNATIRDNLLLARPLATDEELAQAVRSAGLDAFIGRLPEAWDTWVGEQGLRLSGGERQRLAIARALLRDAPLLILDEATASLDPHTENVVLAAIANLMKGRTTLMITHQLAGPEEDGRVLVLDAGHAVQEGTRRAFWLRTASTGACGNPVAPGWHLTAPESQTASTHSRSAGTQGPLDIMFLAERRKHQHGHVAKIGIRPDREQGVIAIEDRHQDVAQHGVRFPPAYLRQSLLPVRRQHRLEACGLQHELQERAGVIIIINYQDSGGQLGLLRSLRPR